MPRWLDTCTQPVPIDEDGMSHPQRCPCSQVRLCPDCTLECLQGKKWCMFWTTKNGKERRQKYDPVLYRELEKKEYRVFTTIPAPFSSCHICMYRMKFPYYSTLLGESEPFEQIFEDLPF